MSRMFCIARYGFILGCRSVRERAKRAEPLLSLSSLRITNPPTSRMPRIVESRDQLTQARPCGNGKTPPWGNPCRRELYNTPQKFMPKFYDICPLSSINWNNPLSVKTCLNISSNTFVGIVQICAPA